MPDKQNDDDKVDDKVEDPIETNIKNDVDSGSQEVHSEYDIGENGLPEKWKNIPFDAMRAEGWHPRIKNKGGRQYLTMRKNWVDTDRKQRYLERGMGPFSEERYKLLQELLLDEYIPEDGEPRQEEIEEAVEEVKEDYEVPQEGPKKPPKPKEEGSPNSPKMIISDVDESTRPKRFPQPPAWTVKGTRILQSAVSRHINIPDRFYYDTDLLEFYEYFHNKGYSGTIVDWIHECVRNYMIEHHHKVGVIIEKGMMIQNG